jgi:hypothetical protein
MDNAIQPPHGETMPNWKMLKATWGLRGFAMTKIPLIAICRPTLLAIDREQCVVSIPFAWLAKNHLRSMYFGALCIGADAAGGLIVMNMIQARKSRVAFLFKDFKADFHKRVEGTCLFTCTDGAKLAALLAKAEASGEREEDTVTVIATVPDKLGDEPAATFQLTISMKKR